MAYARRFAVVALIGAAGAGVVTGFQGCSIYDSSLLLPASGEAGADGASDAVSRDGGGDTCAHARPPSRPDHDDATGDHGLVVAIHSLDFGAAIDAGIAGRGYDLDNVCTCPGVESCTPQVAGVSHCDDDAGRDDGAGILLKQLALVSGGAFSQTSLNGHLVAGDYGLLVRIQGYNGGQNDTQVVAAIFASDGTPTAADGGKPTPPVWDGNDSWTVDSASVFGGADGGVIVPNFADPNAYIANGVLVAQINFPLTLGSGAGSGVVTLDLVGGFVTARVVQNGSSYELRDGQLVGRWPTKQMLSTIGALNFNGSNLCPGTQSYRDAKSQICRAADIAAKVDAPASAACDALSIAVAFDALPAKLGDVMTKPVVTGPCGDAGAAGADDCP